MKDGSRVAPNQETPKRRMKKGWKIALIVAGSLLGLVLVIGLAGYLYLHSAYKAMYDDGKLHFNSEEERQAYMEELDERIVKGNDDDVRDQEDEIVNELKRLAQEAAKNGGTEPGEEPGTDPGTEPQPVYVPTSSRSLPEWNPRHDDNVINILLIGTDERGGAYSSFARGDTCMILSLNKATGRAKLVSLERGVGVPILDGQYKGQWDWLTHTFCYGGADLMMREVRECFNVEVYRYIRVNFSAFRDCINAIGGVDITLTQAEADYINNIDPEHPVTAGTNHMYGYTALLYARTRKIDSDWNRIKRQRTVIQAAINQTRNLSPGEFNSLLMSLKSHVRTNLTEGEIMELLSVSSKFQGVTLEQKTIPESVLGGMRGMGGRSLYAIDFTAAAAALEAFLYG